MKNLSNNKLKNFICKVPAPEIETPVIWAKYSLVIGAALLAGLLPIAANAQVSQETLNLSPEQNGIDQTLLFPADEGIVPLSQERLNLLSEQDRIAQQQLSGQNEGGEISLIELGENSLVKPSLVKTPDSCLALSSFAAQGSCGIEEVLLETAVSDTYTARQIAPNRCKSYFANYGCYAIEGQPNYQNSNFASAYGASRPTAAALNAQENNRYFFPQGDPPGTWLQANHAISFNDRYGFNEFAVGAAKVINDWKSPVFFDVNFGFGNNAIAVLESITFDINNTFSSTLGQLCNIYRFNDKAANVSNVASSCGSTYGDRSNGFKVSSIDIAYWSSAVGNTSNSRVDITYSGNSLNNFILNNFNQGPTTTYVWDPPETAETAEIAEPVPEPSSALGLLAFGLFSVGSFFKRKRK